MSWIGTVGTLLFGACVLLAVAPIRRPWPLGLLSWMLGSVPTEVPFVFLAIVVVSTGPDVATGDAGRGHRSLAMVVTALSAAGLVVLAARAGRAAAVLARALDGALGPEWPTRVAPDVAARVRRSGFRLRPALFPWPVRPRHVEKVSDLSYGPKGRAHRLDVYRRRDGRVDGPTLVHLHGGQFRWGAKSREARALLHRLASRGWTCVSANYELSPTPAVRFPEPLVDVKRLLGWLRRHGSDHGIPAETVIVTGSSAGAHLATMAAVTPGDVRFQPGFEDADTSVSAVIGFYGYYGGLDAAGPPSTPLGHAPDAAPPALIVHGTNDTFTPVEGARELADHLRAGSTHPVALAELPGAQHSFDVFHSIRYDAVIDAVAAFGAYVAARAASRSGGAALGDLR